MFWIAVAALLLISLLSLSWPWLTKANTEDANQTAANKALWRKQQEEIKAQFETGELTEADYESLKQELDKRLLQDVDGSETISTKRDAKPLVLMVVAIVTLATGVLAYQQWGDATGQKLSAKYQALLEQENPSPEQVIPVLNQMRAHGEQKGASGFDWLVLAARGYMQLQYYRNASETFDKILALDSSNASFLADAAQAHYLANDRQFTGKPEAYIEQALVLNPQQANALGFAGMAAFESEQYAEAADYWQQLIAVLPPSEQQDSIIVEALQEAQRRAGLPTDSMGGGELAAATIKVQISLAEGFDVQPSTTVFVTARAKSGPAVPLAVKRFTVADLPANITLSPADAMSPQFQLTQGAEVLVKAKVSTSGNAISQSGDIESLAVEVVVGTDAAVSLEINQLVP